MTSVPYVELTYGPSTLDLATRQRLGRPRELRSLQEAMADALTAWRTHVITEVRSEVKKYTTIDAITINKLMDRIWALYTPRFSSLMIPFLAQSYAAGFAQASAGKVPPEYLESLARDYAMRLGTYYHASSKDALLQGFQTYVNRRVAAKVAFDRVLGAYGLTPRQMSGFTSLDLDTKVSSAQNLVLQRKSSSYISSSLRQRLGFLTDQEEHNLDQQAQQMAWMWMERRGRLSKNAMKTWITAKDERVCALCGPLHGMKIPVLEKFPVGDGSMWVPGVHPNCRCEVRLTQLLTPVSKSKIVKADKWFNDEYERTRDGRFARKTQRRDVRQAEPPIIEVAEVDPTPLIEATPELTAAPEKPKLVGKPKLAGKPALRGAQPPPLVSTKPELQGKPELSTAPALFAPGEKPALRGLEPATKNKLIGDISILLRRTRLVPAPTPPYRQFRRRGQEIMYAPVKPILDVEGNPMPVYAVLPGHRVAHHDHIDIQPEDEMIFTNSEEDAAVEAADLFEATIDDVVDQIRVNQESRVYDTAGPNLDAVARVDPDDVYSIVSSVAHQLGTDAPYETQTVNVVWETEDGEMIGPGALTYAKAIEQWQLDPQLFEVAIVKMQEGHDSSLGDTKQVQIGSKFAAEEWMTTGRYVAHLQPASGGVFTVPVSLYDILPDVELFESPPEAGSYPTSPDFTAEYERNQRLSDLDRGEPNE